MPKRHNVNVDAIQETMAAIQSDPTKAKRTQRVQGLWNLAEGQPQFTAEISFPGGTLTLESDQPPFQGGAGTRPGSIQYALFGLASCFTTTFVSVAAVEGLPLDEVRAIAEFDMNLSKTLGLADLPIIEEVRVTLKVRSPAPRQTIEAVARLAEERCPAVYCLTNPIPLTARVVALEEATP